MVIKFSSLKARESILGESSQPANSQFHFDHIVMDMPNSHKVYTLAPKLVSSQPVYLFSFQIRAQRPNKFLNILHPIYLTPLLPPLRQVSHIFKIPNPHHPQISHPVDAYTIGFI